MGISKKCKEIQAHLFEMQDEEYRDFQSKLIPTVDAKYFIGVRTPDLRKYASALAKQEDTPVFLNSLPHKYFDENQLHAFIISGMKDYESCVEELNRFLPYVDNWATCDQMSPKVFKKHRTELLDQIREWIRSDHTYTVRFGIGMLMEHYLDDDFDPEYPEMVAKIRSEEYYINMMIAWYFATALAKQYETILPFILEQRLDAWTHNKAIQKAVESNRITAEQKAYLKTLKVK
ncbi:MAG: DNA alkylation repair protein [Lachnospiraceae bacterium]|nr:DNA alkylation repair protein [Lachnospiraceae bacterium]